MINIDLSERFVLVYPFATRVRLHYAQVFKYSPSMSIFLSSSCIIITST